MGRGLALGALALVPSALAGGAPLAAIAPAATSAVPARRGKEPAQASKTGGRPVPLVTTITRIVGVVPVAVRVLIGALLALALAMAVRSRLTARRARRLERQRRALLEDVGLLQAALLPVVPGRLGPVGTSAAYRPAEGPGAGGDFYDLFALEDGRLAVIVGDVSGHGRGALPHTALVRFTLRAYLEAGLAPREAVQMAGAVLERQLGETFVTVVAATYHPRERVLVYACAGHPPPVVLGARQSLEPITACSSPPIGAGMRTGTRQTTVSVPGYARVCLHTDGVTDARVRGELFGAERLTGVLAGLGAGATAPAVLEQVVQQTGARPDDMAACVLSIEGDVTAPLVLTQELELDGDEAAGDRPERFLRACGVGPRQAGEAMRSARIEAERAGAVLLGVSLAEGSPEVSLRSGNVASIHAIDARRRAAAGAWR